MYVSYFEINKTQENYLYCFNNSFNFVIVLYIGMQFFEYYQVYKLKTTIVEI